ncbi:UNKNOWN [Stylonychia lemnae]|uniref:C2H2-type domain-containing protein n=1 Tax=Stylonychia lemnae TaxID=5949 RepID=A0A077ZPH5_STYLE|nr:UNKNOWN [Stylonychia lemnae]|eukprot:CDW71344.1 UNKNOWN [Stylonychia lemnae]
MGQEKPLSTFIQLPLINQQENININLQENNTPTQLQYNLPEKKNKDSCVCKCNCGAFGEDFMLKHRDGQQIHQQLAFIESSNQMYGMEENTRQKTIEPSSNDDSFETKTVKQTLKLPERSKIQIILGENLHEDQIPQVANIPSLKTFKQVKVFKQESKRWKSQFICTFDNCNIVCQKWGNLFDHLRTHSNERPFKCPVEFCRKAFTQKSNLEKHIKTHKRLYLKCQECKSIFHKDRLLRHFNKYHSKSIHNQEITCGVKGIDESFTSQDESEE